MDDRDATLAAEMSRIWATRRAEELERVEVLERAVTALGEGEIAEPERRAAAAEAHRLAGSLAVLRFDAGSASALELSDRLARVPRADELGELSALVDAVRDAVESAGRG